ncbi:proliferation marker protein Ki-67 [Centroberyx affinis]|uniref:proliferation marker protein Ki-67 n=1 Tax=Centroberyx affinis TaxID=166261 RepID=UPI003A5C0EF1
MPLHGKIVVIKRSGGDGTEFPLTASCLFGRKPDCDIRIQLPQVSKEHCRIELNENKEVILTNLSSVNPTRVNGEELEQSERLKHGDVITIVDRSFRFEYPPAPTPKKKRSSIAGKTETFQVLQDQVRDTTTVEAGEKRISEVSTDPHLKDGTNNDNIQRSLEKSVEVESKEDGSLLQSKTSSPFNELYQMIKQTLDAKTPRKSSVSVPQTPASRFCTPKPGSVRKVAGKPVVSTEVKSTPKKVEDEASCGITAIEGNAEVENNSVATPKSAKKQRKSFQVPTSEMTGLVSEENKPTEEAAESEATSTPQRRLHATPQRFTVSEVVEQISAEKPTTPTRRRSKEATPVKPVVTKEQEEEAKVTEVQPDAPKTEPLRRTSPRSIEKKLKTQDVLRELDVAPVKNEKCKTAKKRKSGELGADLLTSQLKKKRVSFGGHLSPELFDKRLPPDSPLRKGAAPRRSLCLVKPKLSLLRRASAIGLMEEFELEHPALASPKVKSPAKARTPSPKKSPKARTPSPKTPSPGKKSPKAKTPSPKTPSPGKKSPKAKTPSPKTPSPGKKSPKSTPAQPQLADKKTPTGKRRSSSVLSTPTVGVTSAKTPLSLGNQTPTVQGRFSVSRISTPSPVTEQDAVAVPVPVVPVTPKVPLRRKSMKSASRKTPSMAKSTIEVLRRRSGISRASMKVNNSYADIVKFGQTKSQVVAAAKKTATTKKTKKVVVPNPKTPARKLQDHVSTGHADSPVTIVVGRAYKQKVVQPTGAAPRLVHNTALLKKNMKMDEDLTGIAEIFKTPARQRKSVINVQSAPKTPQGAPATSMVEASVLNTPEEPGEMMVSPLNVTSAVTHERYNSEAVQRLLHDDEEPSFVSEIPALEIPADDSSEQQCTDLKTSITTPKQKPEQPDCLTGVKRIMKTPRQKAEPIEDLRGKLLKTPKQKPEQPECLTGVKRIMKTPRQKAEPIEDLRGKLLKTPKAPKVVDVELDGVKELLETPVHKKKPVEDLAEVMAMKTPEVKSSPLVCANGELMGNAPVEDSEGLQELMEEPLSNPSAQMETNEGHDQTSLDCGLDIAKEPEVACEEQQGDVPCEDHSEDGPSDMEKVPQADIAKEPEVACEEQQEDVPCEDHSEDGPSDIMESLPQADIAKEPEVACEEQQEDMPCEDHSEDGPSDIMENLPQADLVKEAEADEVVCDDQLDEVPCGRTEDGPSDAMETVPQAAVDQNLPEEQPEVETAICKVTEVDTASIATEVDTARIATEVDTASIAPDTQKKSARGRRAKVVGSTAVDDKQEATEHLEDTVAPAPVRGRRGKKTDSAPPATVRQTARSRNAKCNESRDVELTVEATDSLAPKEEVTLKPKRGRNAKKAAVDEAEMLPEIAVEVVSDQTPPVNVNHEANDSAAPLEEAVLKPKRGRKTKQASVEEAPTVLEKTEVVSDQPLMTDAQPEEPIPTAAAEKPRRGRKTKQESVEQNEVVEDTGSAVEIKQQSQAPVRAKRGRNAKQEKEKVEDDGEIPPVEIASQEKSRRTRKAKQDPVEPTEVEVQMVEIPVIEKVAAPLVASKARRTRTAKQDSVESTEEIPIESASMATPAEAVEVHEKAPVEPAEKPRRGGRKTKQDTEPVAPVESTEVQVKPTEKPKRGRRVKQEVIEEVEVIAEVPEEKAEHKQEIEENMDDADSASTLADEQPEAPVIKPTRGRGVKSVVKNEVSQAIPAKRTRRGAAPPPQEAADTEAAVLVSKPASRGRAGKLSKASDADKPAEVSVEPAKKGRRAATKPTTDDAAVVPSTEKIEKVVDAEPAPVEVKKGRVSRKAKAAAHSDQANATEDVNDAVVEDTQLRKKSVNWKEDLSVTYDITTPTPVVKATRGRKTKLGDQDEASQATPTKRGRRNTESTVPCTSETPTKPENKRKASRSANKAEEEDLSDKAVPSEPVKRARRGAKAADAASTEAVTQGAEETESTRKVPDRRRGNASKKAVAVDNVQAVEAETQPKTRRGRAAKK